MVTKKKTYKKEDIIIYRSSLKKRGIRIYSKASAFRFVVGVGCVALGVITSLIPFSSIPLYVIGGGLMGFDVVKAYYSIKGFVKYEFKLYVLTASALFGEWVKEKFALYLFVIRGYL